MQIYNIVTAREYERDGEKKKAWNTVGKLFRWEARSDKPEQFSIEMFMQPETKFYVFEQKDRAQSTSTSSNDEL